ncbi:MAG: hypothetical protein ACXU8U_10155 [Asticcacaulis sp.]
MHRSAAPDKAKRKSNAAKDGANVVDQGFNSASRQPEKQGTGHDERGRYARSVADPDQRDQARPAKT